ncbi:MAG: DUF4169 family protein [Terricaulis sp.]
MGDVINLRRARKAKSRAAADVKASENRVAHGRSKAEKTLTKAKEDVATRKLDHHKLGAPDNKNE